MSNDTAAPEVVGILSRAEAEELAGQMQSLAASQASLDADFCALVDRFDAGTGITWFDGIESTAHLVAWSCSMSPGVAREHVRVARALRQMPQTRDLFAAGRLTYSKVREITRLAGLVEESDFVTLALEMTASQLARTVSAFRTAAGTRISAEPQRMFRSHPLGNGMVRLSVVLAAEDAAVVTAAVEATARRNQTTRPAQDVPAGTPAARTSPSGTSSGPVASNPAEDCGAVSVPPPLDRVQALVDIAAHHLDDIDTDPDDDHTLVVVHVAADLLTTHPTATPTPGIAEPTSPREKTFPRERLRSC